MEIPLLSIDSVQQSEDRAGVRLEIKTKDYLETAVGVTMTDNDRFQLREMIWHAASRRGMEERFAFDYQHEERSKGWDVYIEEWYFANYGVTFEAEHHWKLVQNKCGHLCKTYPRILCVPSFVSLEYLHRLAPYRAKRRFPVLTYIHPASNATLWRSSQPKTKFQASKNQHDIDYLAFIANSCPGKAINIYDARPTLNAYANLARGGGFETERNYQFSRVTFLNIANIHVMREAFKAIKSISPDGGYGEIVRRAMWLEQVAGLLRGAVLVGKSLESKVSSLVHCSDGWDRTAQLCTLAQLMLDPSSRSLEGFAILIEKEWLSFGHRFEDRLGISHPKKSSQISPIFLQTLDGIWQLMQQFPSHIEFNERLLIDLYKEQYKGRFGTFMCNCELERDAVDIWHRTVSVWDWVFANRGKYRNPFFQPGQTEAIYPVTSMRKIVPWREMLWPENAVDGAVEVRCGAMEGIMKELQECKEALGEKTKEIERLKGLRGRHNVCN